MTLFRPFLHLGFSIFFFFFCRYWEKCSLCFRAFQYWRLHSLSFLFTLWSETSGNRCDICHPTLSIQFHNNCSIIAHNLQAALCQLLFLLCHLFIFLSTLSVYPHRKKNAKGWYSSGAGKNHCMASHLLYIGRARAHWIAARARAAFVNKVDIFSQDNYGAHPTVHLF